MCVSWKIVVTDDSGDRTPSDEIDAQQNDDEMKADGLLLNAHIHEALKLVHPDSTVKFYFTTEFYWY